MTELPTAETFVPHTEKLFHPRGWHGAVTLVSVDSRPRPGWDTMPIKPFCLFFRGPHDDILPEGYYIFDVEGAVAFDFYIAPVHTPASAQHQEYQAVFG